MEILLQLMEYGKQADAVKLHGTVIKNQLVILLELKTEHKSIKFNKKILNVTLRNMRVEYI